LEKTSTRNAKNDYNKFAFSTMNLSYSQPNPTSDTLINDMISLARVTLTTLLIIATTIRSSTEAKPGRIFELLSEEQLSGCVDSAARLLDIDFGMTTDPSLLNDILEKDMFLADLPAVRRVLGTDLTHEKSLRPMLDQIRKGITVVHPALGTNLCYVLADNENVGTFPLRTSL
jgi:hypothetical protein